MNRVWLVDEVEEVMLPRGRWVDAGCGERADCEGWAVGGLRSEPVSSEEPPPLVPRAVGLFGLARLVLRAGFWGLVSRLRAGAGGSESRDENDVSSEADSAVEEPELAMAMACECPLGGDTMAGKATAAGEGAPLFGDTG